MASKPLLHYLSQQIEAAGGDDYIFDQVADAVPVRKIIAPFINPKSGKPFNQWMLYQWKKQRPDRMKRWEEARKISAHSLIDEAAEALEEASKPDNFLVPAQVSLLKAKVEFNQYLAERYNREDFGKQDTTPIQISFGDAFVSALRQHGTAKGLPAPADEIEEADYVVEGGDDDDPIAELLA